MNKDIILEYNTFKIILQSVISIVVGICIGLILNINLEILCSLLSISILSFWLLWVYFRGRFSIESIPLLVLLVGTFAFSRGFSILSLRYNTIALFITELSLLSAAVLIFIKGKVFNLFLAIPKDISKAVSLYLLLGLFNLGRGLLNNSIFALRDVVFSFYTVFIFYILITFNSGKRLKLLYSLLIPSSILIIIINIDRNIYHFIPEGFLLEFVIQIKNLNTVLNLGIITVFTITFYLFKKKHQLIKEFLICILLSLIIMSGVRSGWVALILSFLFLCVVSWRKWIRKFQKWILFYVILIFIIIYASISIRSEIGSNIIKRCIGLLNWNSQRGAEVQWRWSVWGQTVKEILKHPWLGAGFGIYPEYIVWGNKITFIKHIGPESGIIPAHNHLLAILYKMGIIGLVLFIFINYRIFKLGFNYLKKCKSEFNYKFLLAVLTSIIYWHGMALFFDVLESPPTGIYLWILLGLVLGIVYSDKNLDISQIQKV